MTPDAQVWITTARNGISYHLVEPDGHATVCGRYVGSFRSTSGALIEPIRGHLLPLADVVERFSAKPCRACDGSSERVGPVIRR